MPTYFYAQKSLLHVPAGHCEEAGDIGQYGRYAAENRRKEVQCIHART